VLFFCSCIFPFYYQIHPSFIGRISSSYYWSFESQTQFCNGRLPFGSPYAVYEYWFYNYWFHNYNAIAFGTQFSAVLIAMFIIQILTLATRVSPLIFRKKVFELLPVIFCPIAAGLMVCPNVFFLGRNWAVGTYQIGY